MTRRPLLAALVAALALGLAPAAAHAEFGITPGTLTVEMLDSVGNSETRAGAHPDRFRTTFALNKIGNEADGNVKDLTIDLPQGFVGDPNAVATCPREAISVVNQMLDCPPESQVGEIDIDLGTVILSAPIYSIAPHHGDLAEFGFKVIFVAGHLAVRSGPNGQGLSIEMGQAVQDLPMAGMSVDLWGVPADHQTGAPAPRRAFLTAPTRCAPTLMAVRMRSWQQPDVLSTATARMGALTGCASLSFRPKLEFGVDSATADTPTGTRLSLLIPQSDDPDGQATDRIRDVALRLPEGMALSPSAANGLTACSEGAMHIGESRAAACPASSRVGTVELSTPLLDDPVAGRVYMGRQTPGSDYQLFVVASAPGVDVKLPIALHADPVTGQIGASLRDLPELPFDRLTLSFAGGPRAPLVTSLGCGTGTASATFTPYGGGPPVDSSSAVTIASHPLGGPCPAIQPFVPGFVAGMASSRAGASSPLEVTIRRRDGDRLLDRFALTLPPGLSARLASVERCPAAAVAAASCPSSSRVGSVATEAGAGANPLVLHGDAYLTGRYRHAPFGLAMVFRGVAGPFDLGTISVRAAMSLDSLTGRVTVESDPLPRVVRGIPLRMQTVAFDVDRPGFMTNPTSCARTEIAATIRSAGGAVSHPTSPFVVGGCRRLRFRPAMSMTLTDRSELHAGGHPGMRLQVRTTPRGANIRGLSLDLPKLLGASPTGPTAICSLEQLKDGRCPLAAKIGGAVGRTPLLSAPLRGSAYIVQPPGRDLPDVWAVMRGMGVSVEFRMKIAVDDDGQVHGTLVDLPDMPLSNFTMTLAGGRHGMFSATRGPCARGHARRVFARARLTAQNDATRRLKARVRVPASCWPSGR